MGPIAAILDHRRTVAAVNRAIADLRETPALSATMVAERAAQRLGKPVDDELRKVAAERLKAKFGRPRAMRRRRHTETADKRPLRPAKFFYAAAKESAGRPANRVSISRGAPAGTAGITSGRYVLTASDTSRPAKAMQLSPACQAESGKRQVGGRTHPPTRTARG